MLVSLRYSGAASRFSAPRQPRSARLCFEKFVSSRSHGLPHEVTYQSAVVLPKRTNAQIWYLDAPANVGVFGDSHAARPSLVDRVSAGMTRPMESRVAERVDKGFSRRGPQ